MADQDRPPREDATSASGQDPDSASRAGAIPGAEVSIEFLHARYKTKLLAFFLRKLGAAHDVDDLVQETFLRIAKPDRLQGIDDIEAYLFQIASNLVVERGRRAVTRASAAHEELDPSLEDTLVFSPERILASKDELKAVLQALQELPQRTRTIFALQRFEGLSYVEIARRLGVTPSAIDKQMGKALQHLTKRLEQLK